MTSLSPDFTALVTTVRRFFERDATRAELRASVHDSCTIMQAAGIAPQTMLVALKTAVQAAALESPNVVSQDILRTTNAALTPWMIEVCFSASPAELGDGLGKGKVDELV